MSRRRNQQGLVNKKANIVENESVAPGVLGSVAQAFEKSEYLESRIASTV